MEVFLTVLICSCYLISAVTGDPQNGDLRFIGSDGLSRKSAGRVEIYLNGDWGVIQLYSSTSDWSDEADTICRQQGHDRATSYGPVSRYSLPQSQLAPLLNDITCSSNSYTPDAPHHILRCYHSYDQISDHTLDLAVQCYTGTLYQPYDTQVRLVQGGTGFHSSGFVEAYINGQWGPVCDMDQTSSDTACRQLGYTNAINYGSSSAILSGPDKLDTFSCSRTGPCLKNCFDYPSTTDIIVCIEYSYVNCTFNEGLSGLSSGSEAECKYGIDPGLVIRIAAGVAVTLFLAILICIVVSVTICCCVPGCILNSTRQRVAYQTIA